MGKYLSLLIAILFMVSSPTFAIAAGTVTETTLFTGANTATIVFACTGDAIDGSIPDTAMSVSIINKLKENSFYLYKIRVVPGAVGYGPAEDSDLYITDADGTDILGGAGVNNVDNVTTREFFPEVGGSISVQPVTGALTMGVDNQAEPAALWTITLYFVR